MTTRRRWALATLATFVAIVLAYFFVDRPVSTLAHDSWCRPALAVDLTYGADPWLPVAGLVLLGGGAAFLAGWRPGPRGRAVLAAAIAILLARVVVDELKVVFGRPWPETWIDRNPSWIGTRTFGMFPFHDGRGYRSFPSGHTVDIAAPAAVLARLAPRLRPLAAAAMVAVGTGLVVSDFHFVSDVLAGAYVGVVVGYGVMALMAA